MTDVYKKVEASQRDVMSGPYAGIQWKGTDACLDLHCSCGFHGHVDADFAYFYRCRACKKLYALGTAVRLIPVTEEEIKDGCPPVEDDSPEPQDVVALQKANPPKMNRYATSFGDDGKVLLTLIVADPIPGKG